MTLRETINAVHKRGVAIRQKIFGLTRLEQELISQNIKNREALKQQTQPTPHNVIMYDTTTPDSIRPNPEAVAGYVGGAWPTFKTLVQKFPKAIHLSIAVNVGEEAQVLDVENGDATPAQVPFWVRREKQRRPGLKPWLYGSRSTMGEIKNELAKAGIPLYEVRLWVADPDGIPTVPAGYDAKQYSWNPNGRNVDVSIVRAGVFH